MKSFYRLERLDPETGEPLAGDISNSDQWGRRLSFEHSDMAVVKQWIYHERMHQPEAEFRVTLVTEEEVMLDE